MSNLTKIQNPDDSEDDDDINDEDVAKVSSLTNVHPGVVNRVRVS